MPYWNPPIRPNIRVPQQEITIEVSTRDLTPDIEKFLDEKGWTPYYYSEQKFFQHKDFEQGPSYYEWFEAVAMEMIRFMRIGISA